MLKMQTFFLSCLCLAAIFCADGPIPCELSKTTQDLINKIDKNLAQIALGDLSELESIIYDFTKLHLQDRLEFYKLIFYSPYRFTIPIALYPIRYTHIKVPEEINFFASNFLKCTEPDEFYQVFAGLVRNSKDLLNEIVFSSTNGLGTQTRLQVIEYFSKCFYKLFTIYKSEANSLKIYQNNTITFYESHPLKEEKIITAVTWWRKLLQTPLERSLLLHIDPQISLPIFMNDLIKKARADPGYQMEPRENFILSNLIAKVIRSESCLEFLASQGPEFNSLLFYINDKFPKISLYKTRPLIPFQDMAKATVNSSVFNRKCLIVYDKFKRMSFSPNEKTQFLALKIWKQMYQLAFPKTKNIYPQE
jgi:hypothetical protein